MQETNGVFEIENSDNSINAPGGIIIRGVS
jgi:hypothetical protein